jgi:hypothetical protein
MYLAIHCSWLPFHSRYATSTSETSSSNNPFVTKLNIPEYSWTSFQGEIRVYACRERSVLTMNEEHVCMLLDIINSSNSGETARKYTGY